MKFHIITSHPWELARPPLSWSPSGSVTASGPQFQMCVHSTGTGAGNICYPLCPCRSRELTLCVTKQYVPSLTRLRAGCALCVLMHLGVWAFTLGMLKLHSTLNGSCVYSFLVDAHKILSSFCIAQRKDYEASHYGTCL